MRNNEVPLNLGNGGGGGNRTRSTKFSITI